MSTSGGTWVNAVLFVLTIALAVQIALILRDGRPPTVTWTALGLWLLVAVPSLLQIPFPALLTSLRRDPALIRHHGQVWRVLTSVLVQDGGLPGTVFNLVILAVVGLFAAEVWGPVLTPVAFLLAHLAFNTSVTFLSSEVGAGNSGATLGLAASMAGLALLTRSETALRWRAIGVLGVGIALVGIGDAHGIGVLGGLVIGILVARVTSRPGNLWQTRPHHVPG
jgi:hypothetical protein